MARNVWLSGAQVRQTYGFDPSAYEEKTAAGGLFICNTLGADLERYYLESDVMATAGELRRKPRHPRTVREQIELMVREQLDH